MTAALAQTDVPVVSDGSHKSPPHVPRRFRTDIQALRAIAVLLVFAYHLRPERLTGGYIGVDVFFVISGYLITSHLIREADNSGRIRLGTFWAARARRILPASLVAIAVTIGLTVLFAPVTALENLQRQALASLFYVQNWVLAADAVDYSAADNEATPFQHFWSLSVEEQFYLFWPLLVVLALWWVGRRSGATIPDPAARPRLHRALFVLFGAVVLLSFLYSAVMVFRGNQEAYFVTTTRVWELAAGGLLAVVAIRRISPLARQLLAYGGLAAIAISAFVLTPATPFPGIAALPVILGTMAVILAGSRGDEEGPVGFARFDPWGVASRLRVTQWIGDRSYSLYLWHFPIIILWPIIAERKLGYVDLFSITVVSFVAAHFSYQWIEQPVRRAAALSSTRRALLTSLVAMIVIAAMTFVYPAVATATKGKWDAGAAAAQASSPFGAAAVSAGDVPTFVTEEPAITPSPLDARLDRNAVFSDAECVSKQRSPETVSCETGPEGAERSVVLVGDSHARAFSTVIGEMAQEQGWHLRTYLRNACPFTPEPRIEEASGSNVCTEPNAVVMEEILAAAPDLVITTWSAASRFDDEKAAAAGFADYWQRLEQAGSDVLVIRDVPRMSRNIPDCVASNYDTPTACGLDPDDALHGQEIIEQAAALAPDATIADFTDTFCTGDVCKPVIGNVMVYSDNHHLTDTFARTLEPQLMAAVQQALGVE